MLNITSVMVINLTDGSIRAPGVGEEPGLSSCISVVVGCLMTTIFVLGFVENFTILFVYTRTQKLRMLNMAFVVGLSVSDMGQTVFNIPLVAVSSFRGQWTFGHVGCLYVGYVTTWFGVSQISLLCIIALERYFIIVRRGRLLSTSRGRSGAVIALCFLHGAVWAAGPLLGWSGYKLTAGGISCSINWTVHNPVFLSYTLALFVCVWFLPLSLITFGYINIAVLVSSCQLCTVDSRYI